MSGFLLRKRINMLWSQSTKTFFVTKYRFLLSLYRYIISKQNITILHSIDFFPHPYCIPCHRASPELSDGWTHPCHPDTGEWGLYETALTWGGSSGSLTSPAGPNTSLQKYAKTRYLSVVKKGHTTTLEISTHYQVYFAHLAICHHS